MEMFDTLANLTTGLGTSRDKAAQGAFVFRPIAKYELDASYQCDWLAGSIVDIPPDDMTRKWRTWKAAQKQITAIEATEVRLNVRKKVNRALKLGRLYGGGALLMGDGTNDPSKELRPESMARGGLKYLHVLSRYEITPGPVRADLLDPYFGEPEYFSIDSQSRGSSSGPVGPGGDMTKIHPSRVIMFPGLEKLESLRDWNCWGFSVIQRAYDAIRNVASTAANLSSMAYEAKLDVVKIKGLTANVRDDGYRERLLARFRLASITKSVNGMLIFDAEEEYEQKEISMAGMPDVLRLYLEVASAAADIPATRLLSTSPKGMNATGDSDLRNYYDMLSSQQQVDLGPRLTRLDDLIIRDAIGTRPKSVGYEWAPLWQVRENERTTMNLQKAQTTEIYSALALGPKKAFAKAVVSSLIEDGTYAGYEQALEEFQADPPEPLATQPVAVKTPPAKNAPATANAQ